MLFLSTPKDLSELLKEATKEVHEQAENTPFMRNFQRGQVSLHEFKVCSSSTAWGWLLDQIGCGGAEEWKERASPGQNTLLNSSTLWSQQLLLQKAVEDY